MLFILPYFTSIIMFFVFRNLFLMDVAAAWYTFINSKMQLNVTVYSTVMLVHASCWSFFNAHWFEFRAELKIDHSNNMPQLQRWIATHWVHFLWGHFQTVRQKVFRMFSSRPLMASLFSQFRARCKKPLQDVRFIPLVENNIRRF